MTVPSALARGCTVLLNSGRSMAWRRSPRRFVVCTSAELMYRRKAMFYVLVYALTRTRRCLGKFPRFEGFLPAWPFFRISCVYIKPFKTRPAPLFVSFVSSELGVVLACALAASYNKRTEIIQSVCCSLMIRKYRLIKTRQKYPYFEGVDLHCMQVHWPSLQKNVKT